MADVSGPVVAPKGYDAARRGQKSEDKGKKVRE